MVDRPLEYLGNLLLLIVGGNDTTRNSLSGGVLALNENRDQFDKLKADHGLIKSLVPEIIRWQTPLMHMRRIATRDVELGGKLIKKGDKVVMWYVSGNRDESVIERLTNSSSTAPIPAYICHSALAYTAAWVIASVRCNYASSGRRSSSVTATSKLWANRSACSPTLSVASSTCRWFYISKFERALSPRILGPYRCLTIKIRIFS